jgi:hypothetical protein
VAIPGESESSPVVADIDGDGIPDILFGTGNDEETVPNNLYAFKANGEEVDGFPIPLAGPVRTCPFVCDLDQDGDLDIVYGGWDLLIHVWDMPFGFEPTLIFWPTFRGNLQRDGVFGPEVLTGLVDSAPSGGLFLRPNSPNPFNPTTTVRLHLPGKSGSLMPLKVEVFDLKGRLVSLLFTGEAEPGWHSLHWDGTGTNGQPLASGSYLLRAQSGGQKACQKMTLLK